MGVRGLSTFFNNNPELSKVHKLHNTVVIIDGNNLIHQLYFKYKVDFMFGGEYYKYSAAIRKYFLLFSECRVRPILVLDGGYDLSDRKFQTTLSRSKNRLNLTQQIVKYGTSKGGVLPINAIQVFLNILQELGISYVQADFEADEHITALANYYKCPVLSEDSDFYIFEIEGGFIRLSSISNCVAESNIEGIMINYLPCSIYHIENFLSYFPNMNRSILPLFAALAGNDFVNGKDFHKFFSNIQLPKVKYRGLRLNPKQKQIVGLLSWLKDWDLDYGIEQVLSRLNKERRPRTETIINECVNSYAAQSSILIHAIENEIEILAKTIDCKQNLLFPCGHPLPSSFQVAFHQGKLPPDFFNIINFHRVFLKAQIEDPDSNSSHNCSRLIRQTIYGIILQHEVHDLELHTERCLKDVDEYNRKTRHIEKESVPLIFQSKSAQNFPTLDSIYNLNQNDFKSVFIEAMDAEDVLLDSIPCNWQVLLIAVRFWIKNCSVSPPEEFLIAFVLNIIYHGVILKIKKSKTNQKHEQGSSHEDITTNFKSMNINTHISTIIQTITLEEAESASCSIKKFFHQPIVNRSRGLCLDLVHCYSELQSCILYANQLNSLLKCPLEGVALQNALSGVLLYNLTRELINRPLPYQFAGQLLGPQSPLAALYDAIQSWITEGLMHLCHVQKERVSSKKKKKARKIKEDNVELNDVPDVDHCEIYI